MVDSLVVIAAEKPYVVPPKGRYATLSIKDGSIYGTKVKIMVQAVVLDWGPRGVIRVEGYTLVEGQIRKAIGYYQTEEAIPKGESVGRIDVYDA